MFLRSLGTRRVVWSLSHHLPAQGDQGPPSSAGFGHILDGQGIHTARLREFKASEELPTGLRLPTCPLEKGSLCTAVTYFLGSGITPHQPCKPQRESMDLLIPHHNLVVIMPLLPFHPVLHLLPGTAAPTGRLGSSWPRERWVSHLGSFSGQWRETHG